MRRVEPLHEPALAAVVLAHLVIALLHGAAHAIALVPVPAAAAAFVVAAVYGGPIAGLGLIWSGRPAGAWIVAATMAAALVFGAVSHFMLASPDHVSHVVPEWRSFFAVTAGLLALTEASGAWLALRSARGRRQLS